MFQQLIYQTHTINKKIQLKFVEILILDIIFINIPNDMKQ